MNPRAFFTFSLFAAAALPAYPQQTPNPLLRPMINLSAPLPPPTLDGNYAKASQSAKDGGEAGGPSRPRFDGWYVVFVTDQVAILRSPDLLVGGGDANANKPGSPGFGNGTSESGGAKASPTAVVQTLEIENGEMFTLADAILRANIHKGRVTISYLGGASARRNGDNGEIVFSGRVMSNPIAQTRTMERPDDRYINSVKPTPNSVRNVVSGASGASSGGMSGAPTAAVGGATAGSY